MAAERKRIVLTVDVDVWKLRERRDEGLSVSVDTMLFEELTASLGEVGVEVVHIEITAGT